MKKTEYSIGRAVYDIARSGAQYTLRESATCNVIASRVNLADLVAFADRMALELSKGAKALVKGGQA